MYRIISASRRIERELDKIPRRDFEKVAPAIEQLAYNPRPIGVQKLAATLFRIRVGRYRVIYTVDDKARLVVITKVAKRSESTYKNF